MAPTDEGGRLVAEEEIEPSAKIDARWDGTIFGAAIGVARGADHLSHDKAEADRDVSRRSAKRWVDRAARRLCFGVEKSEPERETVSQALGVRVATIDASATQFRLAKTVHDRAVAVVRAVGEIVLDDLVTSRLLLAGFLAQESGPVAIFRRGLAFLRPGTPLIGFAGQPP